LEAGVGVATVLTELAVVMTSPVVIGPTNITITPESNAWAGSVTGTETAPV
jgi:hypothetical protein